MFKNKQIVYYYAILLLLLLSWNKVDSLPPFILRLFYLLAVVLPCYFKRNIYTPVVLITLITISSYRYAVSYMPVEGQYVSIVMAVGAILFRPKNIIRVSIPISQYMLFVLTVIVNLFSSGNIAQISYALLIYFLVMRFYMDTSSVDLPRVMSLCLSIASFVISIEFLLVGHNFLSDLEGFDRQGWTDPNYFGSMIGMGVLASLTSLFNRWEKKVSINLFLIFSILISIYTIITTGSRGAIVALLIGILVLLILTKIRVKYKILFVIASIFVIFFLYTNSFLDFIIFRFQSGDETAGGRTLIWFTKIEAFVNQSNILEWLFGYGFENAFSLGYSHKMGFHNDYLAIFVGYGITGIILFIAFLLYPILTSVTNKSFVYACIAYLAVVIMSLEPISSGNLTFVYFYIFAMILGHQSSRNFKQINEIQHI